MVVGRNRWVDGLGLARRPALALIICVAAAAVGLLAEYGLSTVSSLQVRNRERQLLYYTDHAKVLVACRQLMKHPDVAFVPESPANYKKLPTILQALRPSYVSVDRDHVMVQIGGGTYHYQFDAYANRRDGSGNRELLPGLWYTNGDGKLPEK